VGAVLNPNNDRISRARNQPLNIMSVPPKFRRLDSPTAYKVQGRFDLAMDNIAVFRHQGSRRETAVESGDFVHAIEAENIMISIGLINILRPLIGAERQMADG
jgi:hypothetical protein